MASPLLRFTLPDARPATLLAGDASTVLAVDDLLVSSWDLSGRPYALVREDGTYRRGLAGAWLHKREAIASTPRLRRRLAAAEAAPVAEAARIEALAALEELRGERTDDGPVALEAGILRLERVVAMDASALARDAAHFLLACGPVGILPPDQYLALVVRLTEGCSWNSCTFCSLYRDVPFRVKAKEELVRHLSALREYFGPSIALRRSVFLGDANALCVAQQRLLPLVELVARSLPGRPLHAFVDAWTGARRTASDWRTLGGLGLERVYVGLETGDPELLHWLGKPGRPEDAVDLVGALKEAGLSAGVIVLLGAGGRRFDAAHVERTSEVLRQMGLRRPDLLYFSEYVVEPGLGDAARAPESPDLQPLDATACARQRQAILASLAPSGDLRIATYALSEFVY